MSAADDVRARLAAVDDAELAALGLTGDDRTDAAAAVAAVRADPAALARVAEVVARLDAISGRVPLDFDAVDPALGVDDGWGVGVLGLVALVAAADDVRAAHRALGVEPAVTAATLADLGRQAGVHRRTFGSFGLHTAGWVGGVFSSALFALGRLQFELRDVDGRRELSTHIPESGPLTPEAVDASFAAARLFFAERFPDRPATAFHCHSWLLDPQLGEMLDPASNLVRFQRRWTLTDAVEPGDEDALFFVFRRRGEVDLATLPQRTSLERAVVQRLSTGGHLHLREGVIPF